MGWGEIAATVFAPAVASVIGGQQAAETNAAAANRATDVNQYEARLNREFQAQQTSAQQEFQRQMSNTAYQRSVEDLKKAGLNPLLAVPGGASTPSGAAASGSQAQAVAPPPVPNHMLNAINTAISTFNSINQARQTNAQATLAEAQATKIPQELENLASQKNLTDTQIKALKSDQAFKNFKFKLWTLGNETFDSIEKAFQRNAEAAQKIYKNTPEFNPSGTPGID